MTACIVLVPAVVVFGIVYLAILFKYYINTRNLRIILNAVASNASYELKTRIHDLWGTPALLGTSMTLFYLTIFYFNSDVPGVKPPLPKLGFFTVRADLNYSFAVLLGILATAICSVPDILFAHASRIYA